MNKCICIKDCSRGNFYYRMNLRRPVFVKGCKYEYTLSKLVETARPDMRHILVYYRMDIGALDYLIFIDNKEIKKDSENDSLLIFDEYFLRIEDYRQNKINQIINE